MRLKRYLLSEFLKPSQARLFKNAILSKKFKSYLNGIFKGKDRIYMPFEGSIKKPKIPANIEQFLKKNGYEIVDYQKGLVRRSGSNKLAKIGKILSKMKEHVLLQTFVNDKSRSAAKKSELLIVVSRHPYDVAGMSTGRGWTSCMDLAKRGEEASMCEYINKDIEHGSVIAYVINPEDKNINKPMSRLLLKPFININNEKDIVLYPEKIIYGASVSGFRKKIIDWLETVQKYRGTYEISPEVYTDDIPDIIFSKGGTYYVAGGKESEAK